MKLKEEFKKFVLYGIGGLVALLINLSLAYIFTEKLRLFYLLSAICSYLLSLIFNFFFQAFITFKTKRELFFKRLVGFYSFQTLGLLLYSILVFVFTEWFKIFYLLSIILSSALVYIFNFLFSRFLVFKK
ncbi:MAG: hypothetical protein KatS3mg097_509 [Candidatus Parcubacteria bacterium]|nr:MAG: hypothetical protein KatS3mg097_509 [Candidatus Parcubacteria bacterium]